MRDVGQRLLIGLAAVAAAVMAVGYAFIAGNIAAPLGTDLGTVEAPPVGEARAILLEDGRPAFIVGDADGPIVIDARAPLAGAAPGRLVSWCDDGRFLDLLDGTTWEADGRLRSSDGTGGLVAYDLRAESDGRLIVEANGRRRGVADGERVALDCPTNRWVAHRPEPGEVFDPSVAADEEPPGWVWLEGRLRAEDGEPVLCDGLDGDCATFAPVGGIDPALIPRDEQALRGSFIGRVQDGVIVELNFVPDPGGPS